MTGTRLTIDDRRIGDRLRQARYLAKLTQRELAARVGKSFGLIQHHENGEVRIPASRMAEFAVILGKPVDWFFGEAGK